MLINQGEVHSQVFIYYPPIIMLSVNARQTALKFWIYWHEKKEIWNFIGVT